MSPHSYDAQALSGSRPTEAAQFDSKSWLSALSASYLLSLLLCVALGCYFLINAQLTQTDAGWALATLGGLFLAFAIVLGARPRRTGALHQASTRQTLQH